ncbi:hypothetical protein [Pengzhenrongella frigida]|uniref:Uncharacterized protein n=1 Tax=Pengzhenrongella frigida TaxID=1259133 RepID=A0A4Q5MVK2_9MICO|nr:hypothetical protein [Cellulomonas sp. HLT2-17]RYV49560.1 hypothetical protein EUA98_18200 [Cellulomonas sp. HLT2-17]
MERISDQVKTWVGILAYEDRQIEKDAQVTDKIVAPESILTLDLKHHAPGQAGGNVRFSAAKVNDDVVRVEVLDALNLPETSPITLVCQAVEEGSAAPD